MSDATPPEIREPRERFSIAEFNEIAGDVGTYRLFRGGVITVHGFNTTGRWQKLLIPTLQRAGLLCTPVDYGFVVVGLLRKKTLDVATEKIMAAYADQLEEPNCSRPSVIAHSLGSLAFGWALQTKVALRVSRVIVNGSILPQDFRWSYFAGSERNQVKKVLNEGGGQDVWPRVARWCVPRAGNAGCYGFNDTGQVVINQINPYGRHDDVHNVPHFRQVWVPFLLTGEIGVAPSPPPPSPKKRGLSRLLPWRKGK